MEAHAPGGFPAAPYLPRMTEPPDDTLDHDALGDYAPGKGLSRDDCPYAAGTEAHARWTAGYDAALREGADGNAAPRPSLEAGADRGSASR